MRTSRESKHMRRSYIGPERRHTPRIYDPLPLTVRCAAGDDIRFEFESVVDNLSAGGLCSRGPRKLDLGEKVLLLVRFSLAGELRLASPRLAARATVSRVRDLQDGTYQFAAAFTHHRFV